MGRMVEMRPTRIRRLRERRHMLLFCVGIMAHSLIRKTLASVLDNGVIGDPKVDCMEDRVRLTFHTERPFNGRIFVKGMIENDKCVNNYSSNSKQAVDFQLINGQCNMRRSRKLGPDQRGVEQSITVIISFHNVFITKVDRAYRCTCFYMEADKVVTNRFDVSMLPTTELIDTARMPLCTYSVRRGSVNGPVVTYATVGEPVFHVWNCDSDMFSMLVHNCFVDDGAGKDRKPLIDEHGCTIDPVIVADLTYNNQANLAYSEVNVFKFADKITTYFQCAVSTCMVSEGMCKGKTPPRCGVNSRRRRTIKDDRNNEEFSLDANDSRTTQAHDKQRALAHDDYVMDLAAEKIVVLDLDDSAATSAKNGDILLSKSNRANLKKANQKLEFLGEVRKDDVIGAKSTRTFHDQASDFHTTMAERVCFSYHVVSLLTGGITLSVIVALVMVLLLIWRQRTSISAKIGGVSFQ